MFVFLLLLIILLLLLLKWGEAPWCCSTLVARMQEELLPSVLEEMEEEDVL